MSWFNPFTAFLFAWIFIAFMIVLGDRNIDKWEDIEDE